MNKKEIRLNRQNVMILFFGVLLTLGGGICNAPI